MAVGRSRQSCHMVVPSGKTVDCNTILQHNFMFFTYILKSERVNDDTSIVQT